MSGARVWAVVLGVVAVHELTADDDQLLTRVLHRARARHRHLDAAITTGVLVTALHLLDALGPADPFRLLHAIR